MEISKRYFGTMVDGTAVYCWRIANDAGLAAELLDYGATIRSIVVPDKNGMLTDVVLGYDTLEEYVQNGGCFGGTVGRFANRIGGACFELNGKTYQLFANNGANHLHGGGRASTSACGRRWRRRTALHLKSSLRTEMRAIRARCAFR